MTPLFRLLPIVMIAVLIAFQLRIPAMAQAQMPQIELSRDMVERFLASYPEIRAIGRKYEKESPASSSENPAAAFSQFLQHKSALGEIKVALDRHGFNSFTEWLDAARSVGIAYGFVKSGKSPGELGAQADKALEEIRSNPDLNDAQKQQMEMMVKQQMGMLKHFEPSPNNLAIVRELKPRIAAVLDSD